MDKPNVILITIDSLRADHLGFMGYKKNVSPNLDAFSKKSVVFNNAFSNGPVTPHSFPSILTSTYPLDYYGTRKTKERTFISEVMQQNGYITAGFHSNAFMTDYFGYNRGWDYFEADVDISDVLLAPPPKSTALLAKIKRFFKEISLKISEHLYFFAKFANYRLRNIRLVIPYKKADKIIEVAKGFIEAQTGSDKPFFLWMHLMDVHAPYFPKDFYDKQRPLNYSEFVAYDFWHPWNTYSENAKFKNFIEKKCLEKISSLYDDGIEYTDRQLGDFLSFLEEKGLASNTIIILTADHGDEFFEHGNIGHRCKLYNELLHVPLVIKAPEMKHSIQEGTVSLLDLAPTICSFANIEKPINFKGNDIFIFQEKPVFSQTVLVPKEVARQEIAKTAKISLVSGGYKYIFDLQNNNKELYNLSLDPKEQYNIAITNPDITSEFQREVDEFLNKNPMLPLRY